MKILEGRAAACSRVQAPQLTEPVMECTTDKQMERQREQQTGGFYQNGLKLPMGILNAGLFDARSSRYMYVLTNVDLHQAIAHLLGLLPYVTKSVPIPEELQCDDADWTLDVFTAHNGSANLSRSVVWEGMCDALWLTNVSDSMCTRYALAPRSIRYTEMQAREWIVNVCRMLSATR